MVTNPFNVLLPKPASVCGPCPLYFDGLGFSEPEGLGTLDVMIVGEALGDNERAEGLPFRPQAQAGSVLERAIKIAGFTRDQFVLWNTVACQPPDNFLDGAPWEAEAINTCKEHFRTVIRKYQPKVIVALGNVAARTLTGYSGKGLGITAIRGFILPAKDYPNILVIPSFHPSFLKRGKMSYLNILIRDLQLAVQIAREGAPTLPPVKYIETPTWHEAEAFRDDVLSHPELPLGYDIETDFSKGADENEVTVNGLRKDLGEDQDQEPDEDIADQEVEGQEGEHRDPELGTGKNIVMCQFSLRPGTGIAFPWIEPYISIAKQILAGSNDKLGFNSYHFDDPKLIENGCEINGKRFDVMWYFHHIQPDLPRGLQNVASFYVPQFGPWKHLASENLANYGCRDVDILQHIWAKLPEAMRKHRVWEGAEKHIREFWPLLQETSARGLPISKQAQDEFRAELAEEIQEVDAELQALYPDAIKDRHPKNGFVRAPAPKTIAKCEAEGWKLVEEEFQFKAKHLILCECVDDSGEITGWTKRVATRCPICKGNGRIKTEPQDTRGVRAVWIKPFKPSKQQLVRYMRAKKHPVPKGIGKGAPKESTGKTQMERLAKRTRDPFYDKLLRLRAIKKMKSAYVDAWVPGDDGRLHATFSFSPATGQLAAYGPNILTTPSKKLGLLGEKFQRTIQAPDGYVLGAFDFSGFHTATLALEAEDPVYMRIAKMDPHSFLTSVVKKVKSAETMMAMSDPELREFLEWMKANFTLERDKKSKPAILGIGFCLSPKGLYERYEENYANVGECEKIIGTIMSIFPKLAIYQKSIKQLAHKQKYLWNRHGFIRWFWDVMHVDGPTGRVVNGDQAEACVAFNPACDAHGHIKDALKRLRARGLTERYGLINIVHDEGLFCWPKDLTEEAIPSILEEMERPSEILTSPIVAPEGLSVAVEAKIGFNRWELMSPEKFRKLAL